MRSSIPAPSRVLDVELRGHLDVAQVESSLSGTESFLGGEPVALLVDCVAMTGYQRDARDAFVAWFKAHRSELSKTAIVTDNRMYKMVVSTMSLATGHPMRAFSTRLEAEGWVQTTER